MICKCSCFDYFSKDPGIEERIQLSLRENLKEIGQRCIQELRDFIEKLRTEQQEGNT